MKSKSSVIKEVRKILDKNLKLRGLRKTPERYAIINEIYSYNHHFDADELYNKMIKKNYRVSKATIYNTLDLLVNIDLVSRHIFKDNLAKYEKSFGFKQHDHIILDNDEILEFCDPRILSIKSSIEDAIDFKIDRHALNFYGICKKCQNKKKKK